MKFVNILLTYIQKWLSLWKGSTMGQDQASRYTTVYQVQTQGKHDNLEYARKLAASLWQIYGEGETSSTQQAESNDTPVALSKA